MNAHTQSSQSQREGLHFLARSLGVLAIITVCLYLRALLVGGFLDVEISDEFNSAILFGLLLLGAVSLLVAWRWPRLGGLMSVLLAIPVAWYVSAAIEGGNFFAAFIYSSPLLIAGAFFLVDARSQSGKK